MIFDGHGDIWTDVTLKRNIGKKDVIRNMHLDRFKKGNMIGGIFVVWIDPPYDENPRARTLEIIENMSAEIMGNADILRIVRNADDFDKALSEKKLAVIIGMEGLSGIGDRVSLINALYMFGVRHMSLTWNEENPLATGVGGNPNRGLTREGIQAVKLMERLGILIDLAHANDRTFWDVCEHTKGPIINTHSNSRTLCNVSRNITDEQMKAIAERGGLVGLNSFGEFVHTYKDKRDIAHLTDHLDYMIKIAGINHVGFGFDFFHYLTMDAINSFVEDPNIAIKGLETIAKVPFFLDILRSRGYSEMDIEKISYKNYYRVIKRVLG